MRAPSWLGWVILAALAAMCMFIGNVVGRLAGFPYYEGYQGVMIQQPWPIAIFSVTGAAIAAILTLRITVSWTRPLDERVGAAISLLVIGGLSIRSGGMLSVMQAADGNAVFWYLAIEALVLLAVVMAIFLLRYPIGGTRPISRPASDATSALVQAAVFAVSMWVIARTPLKAQGICSVLASGVIASYVTHLLIGKTWRYSWSLPLVVAIVGYIVNAFTASGVEIAKLTGPFTGLAMATPLDYAAFGPIGLMIGEMLQGHQETLNAPEPTRA